MTKKLVSSVLVGFSFLLKSFRWFGGGVQNSVHTSFKKIQNSPFHFLKTIKTLTSDKQFVKLLGTHDQQDAEDDDAPLQPGLFVENFYDGIGKGSAKTEEMESQKAAQTDGTVCNCSYI